MGGRKGVRKRCEFNEKRLSKVLGRSENWVRKGFASVDKKKVRKG